MEFNPNDHLMDAPVGGFGVDIDMDGLVDIFLYDTDNDGILDTEIPNDLGSFSMDYNVMQQDDVMPDPSLISPEDDMPNYDPTHSAANSIIGNPAEDMQDWHVQQHDDTCAVVSQEFILEELTGQEFDEEQLRDEAMEMGVYTDGGGTTVDNVGDLIEAHGFDVDKTTGNTLEDLSAQLEAGNKVIVGVDGYEIWTNGEHDSDAGFFSDLFGLDKDANHAVEVIGIDNSDPDHPMVILNDPGHPDGQGMMVDAEVFMNAWNDSDNFMVNTTGEFINQGNLGDFAGVGEASLGGYYNNDGTYHWSSDNTDTDNDGNIVGYDS